MKKNKWYIMCVVVAMGAVLLVLSVQTGRFDANFADRVVVIGTDAKSQPDAGIELDASQIQELKDILHGKKIWADSVPSSPRNSVRIVFSSAQKETTLYLAEDSEGMVTLSSKQYLNLTQSEIKRVRKILSQQ